ncbi:hypothetical protein [uncultured Aquimarina sp.]|uniref:hypothetical protein n=1 Tax=uncultured Aquimarina sp. TaxID=575652 RepID=UPI0026072BBC|nr:hypothetical protein [uncultured Aquimarina sp.]
MVTVIVVRTVKEVGQVRKIQKVIILSGSFGTRSFNLQSARVLRAEILSTTTSKSKTDYTQSLGVDIAINTSKRNYRKS